MSISIKYSATGDTKSLRLGNYSLGTGDVGKGPSSDTGYYNGVNPPTNGYVVYLYDNVNSQTRARVANDDDGLQILLKELGSTGNTLSESIVWVNQQNDIIVISDNDVVEGIVTDGLVMYLDAGLINSYYTGNTWYDLSGNGNHGSLINSPQYSGGTFILNGSSNYIEISHSESVNIRNSISVCMYCKSNQSTWSKVFAGVSKYNQFILGSNGTNDMGFLVNSGTWYPTNYNSAIWGQSSLNKQDYHYYVGTYNSSNGNLKFYVDGNLEASFNIGLRTLSDDPNSFTIGKRDVSEDYLNATIAGAQIYNRELTQDEIIKNYNLFNGRFGVTDVTPTPTVTPTNTPTVTPTNTPTVTPTSSSPWTLSFTGADCGSNDCSTNTQSIPESITLFIEVTLIGGAFTWFVLKNGSNISSTKVNSGTFTHLFSLNDILQFTFQNYTNSFGSGTATIKETNSSGRVIGTFSIFVQGGGMPE